ncbi:hypothetical protein Tco_0806011 [Tanacetum coccineum]
MAVLTQPTLSLGISSRVTEAMALSPSSFRKRYRSSYETPSSSASPSSSLTLPIRKSEESKDEGPSSESEEAASEEQQSVSVQQTVEETTTPRLPIRATWEDPVDGTVYTNIECVMPPVRAPVQTLTSLEWSSGSLPVSLASLTVPLPIASLVTTPITIIVVDEHEFLEVGAQLELYGSILHDHTQRLDALPPTLFERYGRDFTRLFTRSEAIRDEIHL